MQKINKVLIVGTGIGGGALACALADRGIEVHAIDNKPCISAAGTGICLLGNTLRALDSIGLKSDCLERGAPFHMFREFDSTGSSIMACPIGDNCGIKRPELSHVLESHATRRGAILSKNISIESVRDDGRAVLVRFTDGSEAEYDLLVAADGAFSRLRDQFFGQEFRPRFAKQSVWRFNARRPASLDGFHIFRAANGTAVGVLPTSAESCYLFHMENSQEHLRYPDDELDGLLIERLRSYDAPLIRDALEQIKSPADVLFRPFDITLVPAPWHRNRIVLLGDAAHAPTPQLTSGGGMAVEDAVVLAQVLSDHPVDEALNMYSQRRFDRVKRIFDASYQLSVYEQNPLENREKSAKLLMESYQFIAQPC
ncbi:FAD-dependent monooxygenase [Pseudomonas batumici]|uniref:2-polyprenyl-6-methoxyphenol hydroxylase n=1 Tax=Pseudomonas batumici TaxID=226910 RepID=A0A0C2IDD1_9PSED|nr:FAD-dependent monooxygenase [Pseudomonas batumici]KIH83002.1 2-polyprenyl-6-methoxyphenol hydroxylase [Pseudomonas batumici]